MYPSFVDVHEIDLPFLCKEKVYVGQLSISARIFVDKYHALAISDGSRFLY